MFRRTFLLLVSALALAGQPRVTAVDSVGLTVSDLQRSVAFYTQVLDFEKVAQHGHTARLRLGDESIELTQAAPPARPAPNDVHSNDRWFQHIAIIVSDMPRAYAQLRAHNVEHVSPWPQRLPDWNPNAAGIEAFYFHDPDGHPLEILAFPTGKGEARWQAKDRLFLGIDHTAIVISNTDDSLRFYRDGLGLHIAGESENYGIEQERLNNVSGAHLRITSLRASSGPGVEFLEYLEPSGGRPYPVDAKSNDLIHSQTNVLGAQPAQIRDPDGHTVEIR